MKKVGSSVHKLGCELEGRPCLPIDHLPADWGNLSWLAFLSLSSPKVLLPTEAAFELHHPGSPSVSHCLDWQNSALICLRPTLKFAEVVIQGIILIATLMCVKFVLLLYSLHHSFIPFIHVEMLYSKGGCSNFLNKNRKNEILGCRALLVLFLQNIYCLPL